MNNMIQLAAETTETKSNRVKGIAYSGGTIKQWFSPYPIVIDLAGLKIAAQVPLIYSHEYSPGYRLGMTEVVNTGKQLTFTGEIDADSVIGQNILNGAKKWDWQASIGADIHGGYEVVKENEKIEVNGQEFTGPIAVIRACTLREISVVVLGADADTNLTIAAALAANNNKGVSEMSKKDNPAVEPEAASVEDSKKPQINASEAPQIQAAVKPENSDLENRIKALETQFNEQAAAEAVRAKREAPGIIVKKEANEMPVGAIISASLQASSGVAPEQMGLPPQVIEAAKKEYRDGMSLKHAVLKAARANGCTDEYISASNWNSVTGYASGLMAGFSNVNLSGILGNVINKNVKRGFEYAEQTWRQIAEIANVSDFKAMNSYRLQANGEFLEVPKGGELKHGSLSEDTWSNAAKTYGMMYAITRTDIINDDQGAITTRGFQFGRKAGVTINKKFWAAFLNNASFFTGDKVWSSATALSVEALAAAVQKFLARKDSSGEYIGSMPKILLVPPTLLTLAEQLYNDRQVIATGVGSSKALTPAGNPNAGKYKPLTSVYLEDSGMTGYSATDYYLLDDPMNAATMQVVFLDGRQTPIVESSEAEFNTLGIQFRSYFDFGVAQADPAGGFKADVD